MARNLSGEDYRKFLNYFENNFPVLRSKFPKEIEWSLLSVPYGTRKPSEMGREDFDSFREIELRWLIENDVLYEKESAPSFVMIKQGQVSIGINKVVSVTKITDQSTRVEIRLDNEVKQVFHVVGDIEFVRTKLKRI